jgi:hypothetical protein
MARTSLKVSLIIHARLPELGSRHDSVVTTKTGTRSDAMIYNGVVTPVSNPTFQIRTWERGKAKYHPWSDEVDVNGPVTATSFINPGSSTLLLTGTTGTITGTSLSASCDSGTVSITGAAVGHPVSVSSTTGADVGGAFNIRGSVTATNMVTVYVCGTGTPASLAYNIIVF